MTHEPCNAETDMDMCKLFVLMSSLLYSVGALHVSGQWHANEFFNFLGKFGFEQTNNQDLPGTLGYIYGNVTSQQNVTGQMALVVLDSEYFTEFFGNRLLQRTNACSAMFEKINGIMWDEGCNGNGYEDFMRRIPCRMNELCEDEMKEPNNVIPGYQFTYIVRDTNQPRYETCCILTHLLAIDDCRCVHGRVAEVLLLERGWSKSERF